MKTSRNDGFSLIEVLVVISIVVLGVSLALPSWNEARSKRHMTNASEDLAMFLSGGRSLAIKHNRNVAVSLVYRDPEHWCLGMTDERASCDCTVVDADHVGHCAVGGVPRALHGGDLTPAEMPAHAVDTTFVFDRIRGTLISADAGLPHYFNLLSGDGKTGLRVGVSATGSTFVCKWLDTPNAPAYRSCEPVVGDAEDSGEVAALGI